MNWLFIILAFCIVAGCESSGKHDDSDAARAATEMTADSAHNSRNSLDWPGVYTGVLPCADCDGIRTSITLHQDGRFVRVATYLGESPRSETDEGNFEWDQNGGLVTLKRPDGSGQIYRVGEERLFLLDENGKRITAEVSREHVLEKTVQDERIEGIRWLLIELGGQRVQIPEGNEQPYFELQAAESKITGHASCNRFFGSYEIKSGNRISFGDNMGMTMMACPDMAIEMAFMEALRKTDNYSISTSELSLNRARMAPLARFSAAGQ